LGQVRGPRSELYEALETATAAHDNPLSIIISTQAPTDADLLSVLIDDALAGHDPRTVCSLYTAPWTPTRSRTRRSRRRTRRLVTFRTQQEVAARPKTPAGCQVARVGIQESYSESAGRSVVAVYLAVDLEGVRRPGRAIRRRSAGLRRTRPVGSLRPDRVCADRRIDGVWHVKPTFWLPEYGLAEKRARTACPTICGRARAI
jgi:hypothetical protein